jgi:hypothetical protein
VLRSVSVLTDTVLLVSTLSTSHTLPTSSHTDNEAVHPDGEVSVSSFCFGSVFQQTPSASVAFLWNAFTVHFLLENGGLCALCPVAMQGRDMQLVCVCVCVSVNVNCVIRTYIQCNIHQSHAHTCEPPPIPPGAQYKTLQVVELHNHCLRTQQHGRAQWLQETFALNSGMGGVV